MQVTVEALDVHKTVSQLFSKSYIDFSTTAKKKKIFLNYEISCFLFFF